MNKNDYLTPNEEALWNKYRQARMWFDQAVDAQHAALGEARAWKSIAEWRYRRSTTYVIGFCMFVLGMVAGLVAAGLR